MNKITVFTPTYNRAYIIEKLYRSLQRQIMTEFEWLVVDDGSSDNTEELFDVWMRETNSFRIRYYKKENGGKCSAINYGLDLAEGKLFFTVDSDDYLTDDALAKIVKWEEDIPKKGNYCGFAGNLGTEADKTINSLFGGYLDGTLMDRYYKADGERAIVLYTDIHRKYKYPVFSDEKFMTEAVVWNRMAHDGYRFRFYDDIIWIYEYKEDGLTMAGNRLFIRNPKGYALWMQEKVQFENPTIINRFKVNYALYCELKNDYTENKIRECLNVSQPVITLCRLICKLKHK